MKGSKKMKEKLNNDIKQAMLNKNKELLSVLRMVKGAIQLDELNTKTELNEEQVIAIITKQIKTRKETIIEMEKANREDLITQNQNEIEILEKYMPEQMTEEEITEVVKQIITQFNQESIEFGKVMGKVSSELKGKADMILVNKIVKQNV